jgi:hypothetical protein
MSQMELNVLIPLGLWTCEIINNTKGMAIVTVVRFIINVCKNVCGTLKNPPNRASVVTPYHHAKL